jgi:hypothetical protein
MHCRFYVQVMPPLRSASDNIGDDETEGWRNISNRQIYKSWGSMNNFMLSYGLKMYNSEDVAEAHEIIDAFKQHDWDNMTPEEKNAARAHRAKYKY